MEFMEQAIAKIDKELKAVKGDKYGDVVKQPVADALKNFCRQEDEFAQAIVQSDKTLSDCVKAAVKNCGNAISDIEVYARAVKFYFPTAKINFAMTIDTTGQTGYTPRTEKSTPKTAPALPAATAPTVAPAPEAPKPDAPKTVLNLNFDDLFDI